MIQNLKFRWVKFFISVILCLSLMLCNSAPASADVASPADVARCSPDTFEVEGRRVHSRWQNLDYGSWRAMLRGEWFDNNPVNGGDSHFLERAKDRLPPLGINTPDELESNIKGRRAIRVGGSRYKVKLPVTTASGQNATVFYDFRGGRCELVTLAFD